MKKIEIIIRSSKLEAVRSALDEIGVFFLTFSDVKAIGKHRERAYRGQFYDETTIHRTQIDVVVKAEMVETVIDCAIKHARTGEIGDGKIVVYDVDSVYRIRTGEQDTQAI